MTIMRQLKEATKPHHDKLESNAFSTAMMNGTITREDYATLLRKFYTFYAPLEAHITNAPGLLDAGYDLDVRRKTPALHRDLLALGDSDAFIAGLPLCAGLPDVHTLHRALGCLYVFEGATLGGQLILRHMRQHFGMDVDNGCAFFTSYGEQVGPMWKAFGALTTAQATTPEIEADMIDAACQTFTTLDQWIGQVQPWQVVITA